MTLLLGGSEGEKVLFLNPVGPATFVFPLNLSQNVLVLSLVSVVLYFVTGS